MRRGRTTCGDGGQRRRTVVELHVGGQKAQATDADRSERASGQRRQQARGRRRAQNVRVRRAVHARRPAGTLLWPANKFTILTSCRHLGTRAKMVVPNRRFIHRSLVFTQLFHVSGGSRRLRHRTTRLQNNNIPCTPEVTTDGVGAKRPRPQNVFFFCFQCKISFTTFVPFTNP